MGTLHVRGTVQYGLPPGGNVIAASVRIWDAAGRDPGEPVYEGPAHNGEFDGFAGIRNFSGPKLDGSGHMEDGYATDPLTGETKKVCSNCVWVPDWEEYPHIPLLQIEITEGDLHTPAFPLGLPYVAPPDDALPAPVVLVPWAPAPVCLPQDDPFPPVRAIGVELNQAQYGWKSYSTFPGAESVVFDPPVPLGDSPLPMGVPLPELPSPAYFAERVLLEGKIRANRAVNDVEVPDITSLSDYEDLYHFLPRPGTIETWTSDEHFAAQRLAGVNPAMLKRISVIPEKFGVNRDDNEAVLSSLIGEPLADALAGGRLYLLDYEILGGVRAAHDAQDGRYLPAPYALFYTCRCPDTGTQTTDTSGLAWGGKELKWREFAVPLGGALEKTELRVFPRGAGPGAGKEQSGRQSDKPEVSARDRAANLKRWAGVLKAAAMAKAADLERRAKRDPKNTKEHEAARKEVAGLLRFANQLAAAESTLGDKVKEVKQSLAEGKIAFTDKRQSIAEGLRLRGVAGLEVSGAFISSTIELGLSGPLCSPGQELAPIAIQIDRDYDKVSNPVLTPVSMKEEWEVAKLMVQIADLNAHEMGSHLWNAHFAMEPFAVAMNRQLAGNHPLRHLMKPHFYALIFNNHLGVGLLVNPGGGVDQLLGTKLSGSIEIMKRARQAWSFDQAGLMKDLQRRGLDNPADSIRDYPYRDDAILVCGAIEAFVTEYVAIYYGDDGRVTGDWELQKWLQELRDKRVAGIPEVRSVEALVKFLTQLVFTGSAYHAAVNFTQYDFMAFIPNMPGAGYADPVDKRHGVSWFLPPAGKTKGQLDLVAELSQFRYDQLGDYQSFADASARQAANRFRDALQGVRNQIEQRNQGRRAALKYPYLYPELIPNSTSV
jgi:hypothetical protein